MNSSCFYLSWGGSDSVHTRNNWKSDILKSSYKAAALFTLGCSLFNKCELYFMGIEPSSWFTELGRNLPRKVVQGIEKRSPQSKIFRVKQCFNNIFLYFLHFSLSSSSIPIIYWIIQYFHIWSQNFHLEICALGTDLEVKMIEFGFTPKLFSNRAFLHKSRQILKL